MGYDNNGERLERTYSFIEKQGSLLPSKSMKISHFAHFYVLLNAAQLVCSHVCMAIAMGEQTHYYNIPSNETEVSIGRDYGDSYFD